MNIIELFINAWNQYINFFDALGNTTLIINGVQYSMDYDATMTASLIILGAVIGIVIYSLLLVLNGWIGDLKTRRIHKKLERTLLKARKEAEVTTN